MASEPAPADQPAASAPGSANASSPAQSAYAAPLTDAELAGEHGSAGFAADPYQPSPPPTAPSPPPPAMNMQASAAPAWPPFAAAPGSGATAPPYAQGAGAPAPTAQTPNGQAPYGHVPFGQPQAPHGSAPFGQPQAPYGSAPFGQPQAPYGSAPFGQPQAPYGSAPFGHVPYGQPQGGGVESPLEDDAAPDDSRKRTGWMLTAILGGAAVAVVAGGAVISSLTLGDRAPEAHTEERSPAPPSPSVPAPTVSPAPPSPSATPQPSGTIGTVETYPSPEGAVSLDESMELEATVALELSEKPDPEWELVVDEAYVPGEPQYAAWRSPNECWVSLSASPGWTSAESDRAETEFWLELEADTSWRLEASFESRPPLAIPGPEGQRFEFASYVVRDEEWGDTVHFVRIDVQHGQLHWGKIECDPGTDTEAEFERLSAFVQLAPSE